MKRKTELLQLLEQLEFQHRFVRQAFANRLQNDFGLIDFPGVLLGWPAMGYKEFKAELDILVSKRIISTCTLQDWHEYFEIMKAKALKLDADIQATKKDIENLKQS